ncbi:hypothetical protein OAU50_00325 [Planctomycetota bacterium]|nr:hypothetical protein [Planctomycetota bacterium]
MQNNNAKVRPHGAWYLLVPAILILGLVAFVLIVFSGFGESLKSAGSVKLSDDGKLTSYKAKEWTEFEFDADRIGTYTIDYEVQNYASTEELTIPKTFQARVFKGDKELQTVTRRGNTTGTVMGTKWTVWREFDVEEKGKHRIVAGFTEDYSSDKQIQVDVGGNFAGTMVSSILYGIVAVMVALLLDFIAFVVIYTKRRNSKAIIDQQAYAQEAV